MIRGVSVDLKPLGVEDFEFLYKWNNDPDYSGPFEPFEEVSEEELRDWLAALPVNPLWFVIQTKEGVRVGQLRVTLEGDHAVIGYRVAPPYRGRGYCTGAVEAVASHLLALRGVEWVEAETNPSNRASRRVLEKVGFRRVRYKRKAVQVGGRWLSGVVYERRRLPEAQDPLRLG